MAHLRSEGGDEYTHKRGFYSLNSIWQIQLVNKSSNVIQLATVNWLQASGLLVEADKERKREERKRWEDARKGFSLAQGSSGSGLADGVIDRSTGGPNHRHRISTPLLSLSSFYVVITESWTVTNLDEVKNRMVNAPYLFPRHQSLRLHMRALFLCFLPYHR
jgi:hypothetical protein